MYYRLAGAILATLLTFPVGAQVAVNETAAVPDPSAMLDLASEERGLLVPRLTTSQRDEIVAPVAGLMIYNADDLKYNYYDGDRWLSLRTSLSDSESVVVEEDVEAAVLSTYDTAQGSHSIQMEGATLADKWFDFRTDGAETAGRAGAMFSQFDRSHYFVRNEGELDISYSNQNGTAPDVDNANLLTRMDSTGKVSHGAASLADSFNVAGSIRMVDGHEGVGRIPLSDSDGTMTWSDAASVSTAPDGDASAANEHQDLVVVASGTDRILTLTGGTGTTFSVIDGDSDPANELDSKWIANGSDLSFSGAGQVGIGTTEPMAMLDVNGPLRLRAGGPLPGKRLRSTSTAGIGSWSWFEPSQDSASSDDLCEIYANQTNGWNRIGHSAGFAALKAGDRVLVITTFRFRINGGSGSDEVKFRFDQSYGEPSDDTELLEVYDQHRNNWQLVCFHRVITVASSGYHTWILQVDTSFSDEHFQIQNQDITALKF